MPKDYFDLLIVVPLQEEVAQLFEVFPFRENKSTDTTLRAVLDTGDDRFTAILVQPEGMGRAHAANATDNALNAFDVGLVVCVGIAGGISSDLKIGDVCYSELIYDVLNNSKATSRGKNAIELNFSPDHYSSPREVVAALQFLQTLPDRRALYDNWRHTQREFAESMLSDCAEVSAKTESSQISLPQAVSGAIACGSVSASECYNAKLKNLNRKLLAVETESGGIFEKCNLKSVPALTVRGISDLADSGKAQLEVATSGLFRRIAARNAAEFLKLQFKNDQFCSWLSKRRGGKDRDTSTSSKNCEDKNSISAVIDELTIEINARLTEFLADLKGRAPGYSLPLPRIIEVQDLKLFKIDENLEPEEVDAVVITKNIIAIGVPKNYPDPTLAWIIARNLLGISSNGLLLIPIVVDFSSVKPPRGDFSVGHMGAIFRKARQLSGVKIVHIVDSIQLVSRTKTDYLQGLIKAEADSKFVLIFRNELSVLKENELVARVGASLYKLCEVSFAEIARFVQHNFDMTEVQAEATALKLKKTFAKFQLDAHPTYFAGISRDVLWKILDANRRAELIGLAVSGFLSFIVADDEDDVTLSRSTRERFLRSLATEINIERQTFDLSALTEFVRQFAVRHDFSIDSRKFINGFVDNGILCDFDGRIAFSLPFIEYYLLACELKDNEVLALRYFNINDPEFDFSTFDIYSEIGPSPKVVDVIKAKIQERATKLSTDQSSPNVLEPD